MILGLVIAIALLGLVVIPSMQSSTSSKRNATPESLDLDSVRDALMEKQGWSLERAEAARTEYIRFLTLMRMKPGFMLVP